VENFLFLVTRSVSSGFEKGLSVIPVFTADKYHTSTSHFASK